MKDKKLVILGLVIIIAVHLYILSRLIFFPYPELFIYPYLTNNGLLPYKQIFDQHFPGLFFLPINLNNLGLVDAESARNWLYGIVVATQILLFIVGRKILKNPKWVLLVNFLYIVWQPFFAGWSLWIDSFLPVILLPAFYLLYEYLEDHKKSQKKILLAGFLLGLGIVFKQVLIPLIGLLGFYLLFRRIRFVDLIFFSVGIVVPPLIMIGYFLFIGVWNDFWYWTVIYNLTVYSQYGVKAAPAIGFLTRVFFVFGSSLILFSFKEKRLIHLLMIFLIGGLICVYGRFDFIYFQTALPFAILAFVLGVQKINNRKIQLIILTVYLLITCWWFQIFLRGHLGNQILSFDQQTMELSEKIKTYTAPYDKTFFLGVSPHLYQMTNTIPAGNVFVFQFPWFYLVAEERILKGIEIDNPKIVVVDDQAIIEEVTIKAFADKTYNYLIQNYHEIDRVGTAKILEHNEK